MEKIFYSSTSGWIITHYFVLFGKANQLKLKQEVFFETQTSWLRTRKKMSNHFQPPISIKMVLKLIIASKKWPFHSVKNHALISAIVVTKPSEKFSAEVSFLQSSTSKRIAFWTTTRLLPEKPAARAYLEFLTTVLALWSTVCKNYQKCLTFQFWRENWNQSW